MCKKTTKKITSKRDAVHIANFLNINGMTISLGDLRKVDFSQIANPKASVKSCQETLIAILNVVRGFSET